ncbi:MAG: ABC transporter permease [Candidatus Syntrophoarchaeum sp. WYZ-LMO15]|nr:MAG: ABC transporter permease [Candidatus Syntrophoarchaeum sp. WYZ-LMO15]
MDRGAFSHFSAWRLSHIACIISQSSGGIYLGKRMIIAKKELKGLLNEKTLILALLIQLFIASFSSFLVLGLVSLYNPGILEDYNLKGATIGIVGDSEGLLTGFIRLDGKLRVFSFEDIKTAEDAFFRGKIDGILVVPDTPPEGDEPIQLELYLPKNSIKATVIMVQLKEPLERFEKWIREVRGVEIPEINLDLPEGVDSGKKRSTAFFEFIYGLLIPLLMLTPAFISGGLMIDLVTEEIDKKTLDMLLVSPIGRAEILDGKLLVATLIAPLQALCWLSLMRLNGIEIQNILLTLLIVLAVTAVLTLICAILSVRLAHRGNVQLLYSLFLVVLFAATYTFPVMPFNLITRLTAGSNGASQDGIFVLVTYALLATLLYALLRRSLKPQ